MIVQILAMAYLTLLAIVDALKREISLGLLAAGMIPAIMVAAFGVIRNGRTWDELFFGMVPGLVLLCLAGLGKGAGAGDGIVLIQLNLYFLLSQTIVAFCISIMAIGLFAGVYLLFHKESKNLRLPYMPFLWVGCLGSALMMME